MENDLMLDLSLGEEFGAEKSEETDKEEMVSTKKRETEAQKLRKRTEMNEDEEHFLELSLRSAISEPEIIHVEEFMKGRNIERSLSIEKLDQIPAAISSSTTMKSTELQRKNDHHEANNSFATDEKEDGVSRKKLRLSGDQAASLEESFKKHRTLDTKQKLVLAEKLNLKPRQVEVWFQNRRARTKLKKTETDYKYLKRCYHMLTLENRQLQREVAELRMLRKSTVTHPFYMHYMNSSLCMSCKHKSISPPASVATAQLSKPCYGGIVTAGARQWLP